MAHTLESIGKNVAELHKGLLPHFKAVDTETDKVLRWIEKTGFSVVIVGAWSVLCVYIGARLF